MLPRWLTALPRFAATWRDEILVVALGLAYQAGVTGTFGAPRLHEDERVVVRIAAEHPRAVAVAATHVTTEAHVTTVKRRAAYAHAMQAPVVAMAAPRQHAALVPHAHPVVPPRAVRMARVPSVGVGSDAGENVAADVVAELGVTGVVLDTCTLPKMRASIARARAAMDEARVRAAFQKALAAERALPRAGEGPGV